MKLAKAHVTDFRSVEDSGEFTLDHITSLVGKNEAGKTALLQALAGLNPHEATPVEFDRERDYPRRHLTQYSSRHPDEDATVIRTVWELEEPELKEITAEFGENALVSHQVILSRRYGDGEPRWEVQVDVSAAIKHLISEEGLSASEQSSLKNAETTEHLIQSLEGLEERTPKQDNLLRRVKEYAYSQINSEILRSLKKHLPQFMYFSNYDRMSGEVRCDTLQDDINSGKIDEDRRKGDRLFLEFLIYAGTSLNEIMSADTYESFTARLQSTSNQITDQILEYWTQNPYISITVGVSEGRAGDQPPFDDGVVGRARIYNGLHRVDVPFSERSAGFIWFFSFLIKFAQVKNDDVPVILLLDEPGLSLHGKAQADLLRFFDEQLAPHHQVIYTTHSPFMIHPDRLASARIVEDPVEHPKAGRPKPIGTKVREDVLNTDPDTLFPLQGALGYEITQTLFIGPNALLVEGPGDILYLKSLSRALEKRERIGLDRRWALCPTGGIGKIQSFVSLFLGRDLNIAVLADYALGQKKPLETLRASQILKESHVLTFAEYTGKSESDVEDLFDAEVFAKLLNAAYGLEGEQSVTAQKLLDADSTTERLVKQAEALFRTPDYANLPELDHFAPAGWLFENPAFLEKDEEGISETLDRAEEVFKSLNALLP
jgi:predicted ATP-dependent endonuclease of OLD family